MAGLRLEVTRVNRLISSLVSWLRAGYPSELPPTDNVPLIALLTRQMSPAEAMLMANGEAAE